jgi:AraC family transcriptional regulator of adaptative response / DNA-3-methyladenine glycosylase II
MLDADACYTAMVTRDRRFDGVFFVCVSTTGIYCRPICPARTPGRNRCTFTATPAQAEAAGFRACFRCRPELAPGNADVDAVDNLVAAAAQRIAEGALNDGSVDDLAGELGVSARHLRRTMEDRLGVSPIDLAQTRRLGLAKQLLQDTALPLTEIAFAAGYQSVRRFNAVFAEVMGSPPSKLRRAHVSDARSGETLALRLDYRPPYDWPTMLAFLAMRAIPGVEDVDLERDSYRRIVHFDAAGAVRSRATRRITGTIEVTCDPDRNALVLAIEPALVPFVMPLVARVRTMFDLDARPDVIAKTLGRDPLFGPLVAKRPGLRVPGVVDGFEAAIRALLGQQTAAPPPPTLAGRFAATFGARCADAGPLTHRFPMAAEVAARSIDDIAKVGMPGTRAAAIHGLATALAEKRLDLSGGSRDLDAFVEAATALPGIGPWTAHYLAMRALHLPDAFPAADLGILKALGATPREAETRSAAWRPFRSYAVLHLWTGLGDHDDQHDDDRITTRTAAPARERRRADRAVPAEQRGRAAQGARNRQANAGARRDRAPAPRVLRGDAPDVRPAARAAR